MDPSNGYHAFIVMPFGIKEGIDFDAVYQEIVRPALESRGFLVFRADEGRAGNIHTEMFQELLVADLVVADVSIDNPNVWYELGVRHALRARGVVQIQCRRDYMPFDVFSQRTVRYDVRDGKPDPNTLERDRARVRDAAVHTMGTWKGARISPIYNLVAELEEPEWKRLRVGAAVERWHAMESWEDRIAVARGKGRPGDILVLAGEAPTRVLRIEAHRAAGKALLELCQYEFAREQFEHGLELDPNDLPCRHGAVIALGRLGRAVEARNRLETIIREKRDTAETRGLLARLRKEAWLKTWRTRATPEDRRRAATEGRVLLLGALEAYLDAFRADPNSFYPGINALALFCIARHLGVNVREVDERALTGGVAWAIHCAETRDGRDDYWVRATQGELALLLDLSPEEAADKYGSAATIPGVGAFNLDSSRQQLLTYAALGFREPQVQWDPLESTCRHASLSIL